MIYLDSNATSAPDPGLFSFLDKLFTSEFLGNPSSAHAYGKNTKKLIRETSRLIQDVLSFHNSMLIYTSGATESLNLLIASLSKHSHVITSSMEHSALLEPLKQANLNVTYLDPNPQYGVVTVDQVRAAITPQTTAILLGWVNSEIGTKIDIEAIAVEAKRHQLQLLIDATAIVGREPIKVPSGVTALVFSGHKFHALSGIGCLVLSEKEVKSGRLKVHPLLFGGGQQFGMRSGTEHICGIASLKYIFQKLQTEQEMIAQKIKELRDLFEQRIVALFPDVVIHYQSQQRVNNVSAIAFPPIEGELLQIALDLEGVTCGFGSACSSGATTAFKSLVCLGVNRDLAASTLRFSFSRLLSFNDIEQAIEIIKRVVNQARKNFY